MTDEAKITAEFDTIVMAQPSGGHIKYKDGTEVPSVFLEIESEDAEGNLTTRTYAVAPYEAVRISAGLSTVACIIMDAGMEEMYKAMKEQLDKTAAAPVKREPSPFL